MDDPPPAEALRRLGEIVREMDDGLRALEGLRREAQALLETAREPVPQQPAAALEGTARQGALLVALTLRGGTLEDAALAELADALEVEPAELTALFEEADPHLARRGGSARLTERGLDAAAAWRAALPAGVLGAATRV
ncbi:MAG: hypothetical protein ABR599_06870 [Gemmatimonadota bacterium]